MAEAKVQLTGIDKASAVFSKFSKNAIASLKKVQIETDNTTKKSANSLASFSKSVLKTTASIAGLATGATALRKLGQGFTAAGKTVLDFETQITKLDTLGGEASARIDEIRKRVLEMNPALGDSGKLVEALFEAITKGATVDEAFDLLAVGAKAAVGQFGDLNEIIGLQNQILRAYGDEAIGAKQQMDQLVAITQTGNVTFKNLIPSMGQVLGQASQLGVSATDAANGIAQIAIVTGDAARATTGFRNILNQMVKRQDEFRAAGVEILDVLGEEGFTGAMRAVQAATDDTGITLDDLFTNIRAFNGAAIATGPLLDNMEKALARVRNASGETDTNFNKVTATLTQGLTNIGNAFRNMLVQIAGDDFSGIRTFFQSIEDGINTVANNAPAIREAFAGMGEAITAIIETVKALAPTFQQVFAFLIRDLANFTEEIGGALQDWGSLIQAFDFGNERLNKFGVALSGAGEKLPGVATRLRNLAGDIEDMDIKLGKTNNTTLPDTKAKLDTTSQSADSAASKVAKLGTAAENASPKVSKLGQALKNVPQAVKDIEEGMDAVIEGTIVLDKETGKRFQKIGKDWVELGNVAISEGGTVVNALGEIVFSQEAFDKASKDNVDSFNEVTEEGREMEVTIRKADGTLEKVTKTFNATGKSAGQFSKTIINAGENSKKAGEAFKQAFGEARTSIENAARQAIENFQQMDRAGNASAKAISEGMRKALDEIKSKLGPNAPIVREMEAALAAMERRAGETNETLKREFDDIGVSITLPIQDADKKYKEAFNAIIRSGNFTQEQLHKIFVEQIRPNLVETPNGVPAAWDAKFGEASAAAERLRERLKKNNAGIASDAKDTGDKITQAFREGFEGAETAANKFHGTWLEQQRIREDLAAGGSGTGVNQSTTGAGDLRETGTTTTGDFGQDEDSPFNAEFGNTGIGVSSTADDRDSIVRELALLDSTAANVRGNAWIQRRRELIAQLRALDDAAAQQAEEARRQQEAARQEFINSQRRPSVAAAVGGADDITFAGLEKELQRRKEIARFRQEQVTQGLGALFQEQRANEDKLATLSMQTAQIRETGQNQQQLLQLENEAERIRQRQTSINAEIIGIRQTELQFVEQIRDVEEEIAALREQAGRGVRPVESTFASFSPSGGGGGAGGSGGGGGGASPSSQGSGSGGGLESLAKPLNEISAGQQEFIDSLSGSQIGGNVGVRDERGNFIRAPGPGQGVRFDGISGGISGVSGESIGSITLGGFQNGGVVPETGLIVAERGEVIVPNLAENRSNGVSSGITFTGRGTTDIAVRGETASNQAFQPKTGGSAFFGPPSIGTFQRLAAQGRLKDQLGPQAERQVAKAIVPAQRQAIRRRDITADITRNTPLTQQGAATVK